MSHRTAAIAWASPAAARMLGRVNGFKDMPPWKELYSPDQVISLVAWVMSEDFWP
jgi:hypothetical protein